MAVSTIKSNIPSWEYVGNVYWGSNSWTCPADGFIELQVVPSASNWLWYVSDSEAPDTGWSHRMSGNGLSGVSRIALAKKGAVFSTATIQNVTSAIAYYYKFV